MPPRSRQRLPIRLATSSRATPLTSSHVCGLSHSSVTVGRPASWTKTCGSSCPSPAGHPPAMILTNAFGRRRSSAGDAGARTSRCRLPAKRPGTGRVSTTSSAASASISTRSAGGSSRPHLSSWPSTGSASRAEMSPPDSTVPMRMPRSSSANGGSSGPPPNVVAATRDEGWWRAPQKSGARRGVSSVRSGEGNCPGDRLRHS
jgi:hypothetical protein